MSPYNIEYILDLGLRSCQAFETLTYILVYFATRTFSPQVETWVICVVGDYWWAHCTPGPWWPPSSSELSLYASLRLPDVELWLTS